MVLWAAFAVSGALAGLSGTLPLLALSTVLAIEVFALTALVTLTTQLSELAPTLATLVSPLARMGLPVDGWTTVIALTVRSIPLFLDECRTLWAARRLRRLRIEWSIRGLWNLVLDFTTAILAAAQRRAGDFGREMTLRGGLPPLVQRSHRLTTADAMAAAITLVVCGLCVSGTLLYHL